jgi:hypothetical protein
VQLKALALAPVAAARQEEQDALLVTRHHASLVAIADQQERLDHADERARKASVYTWDMATMPMSTALQVLEPAGCGIPCGP